MFNLLLVIIYIAFISLGLPDSLLGSAWPQMSLDLGVATSAAGVISMLIAGCTVLSGLACDALVRRLGTGKLTAISVGMTCAALFGFSFSSQFWMLCLWAIPYGLGAGAVDAALNNYVALHYKASHMSWLHCFWGLGASAGPAIMGVCLAGGLGWSSGYRTIAIIQGVLTAALVLSLPLWAKCATASSAAETDATASGLPRKSMRQILTTKGVAPILLSFFFYCALEQGTGLWGSSFMVNYKNFSPEKAASLISFFYIGITLGRFICGFIAIKLPSVLTIRLGQLLATIGATSLFFTNTPFTVGAAFLLLGCGCAPIYPGLIHQTPQRFGRDVSQRVIGLQMASAYLGTTFMPPLIGLAATRVSYVLYPVLLLFFAAAMVCLVLVADKSMHFSETKK